MIYRTQTEKEAELKVYRQRFTYCKAYWGEAKLCAGLKYEASMEALTMLAGAYWSQGSIQGTATGIRSQDVTGSINWGECLPWMGLGGCMGKTSSRPSHSP